MKTINDSIKMIDSDNKSLEEKMNQIFNSYLEKIQKIEDKLISGEILNSQEVEDKEFCLKFLKVISKSKETQEESKNFLKDITKVVSSIFNDKEDNNMSKDNSDFDSLNRNEFEYAYVNSLDEMAKLAAVSSHASNMLGSADSLTKENIYNLATVRDDCNIRFLELVDFVVNARLGPDNDDISPDDIEVLDKIKNVEMDLFYQYSKDLEDKISEKRKEAVEKISSKSGFGSIKRSKIDTSKLSKTKIAAKKKTSKRT